ncbi:S26 family signal peptidase, partial [Bacillus spizizenii]|nr:S26 family signal peptidase [Bacillus spizizenii]
MKSENVSKKKTMLEWAKAIVIAVVLALLIRHFIFAPYVVDG